jgi:uncharacterized protein YlxW (UPF0749 family)
VTSSDLLPWQGVFIFLAVLMVTTVLAVLFLRHHREVVLAQAAIAREDAYQRLATQTTTEVARLASEVTDLRRSMAEVERLMRAVD